MMDSTSLPVLLVIFCGGIMIWMSNTEESSPIRRYGLIGWGVAALWVLYSGFSNWRGTAELGREDASSWFAALFILASVGCSFYAYLRPSQRRVDLDQSLAARGVRPKGRARAMFDVNDDSWTASPSEWSGELPGDVSVIVRPGSAGLMLFLSAQTEARGFLIDGSGADLFGLVTGRYRVVEAPHAWDGRVERIYSNDPARTTTALSGAAPLRWVEHPIALFLRDGLLTVRFTTGFTKMNPEKIDLALADFNAIRGLFR